MKKTIPFYRYEGEQNWSSSRNSFSIMEVKETMCNGNFSIHGEIILDNLRKLFRKFGCKAYYKDKVSTHIAMTDNNSSSCASQNTEDMKKSLAKN